MKILRIVAILLGLLAIAAVVLVALAWAPDRPLSALTQRWAQPPSQFVEVAGLSVHLRDEGPRDDPSPIVLIHGTSASLHTWEGWAEALRGQRRVVRFDLPGFGLTGPSQDGDYSLAAYAKFVGAVLDKLEIRHCVLAGNSLGGGVAWTAALAMPQRVDKLVLVDAAGYPIPAVTNPGFRIAQVPVLNRLMEYVLPRSLVAASVRQVYGDPAMVTPALVERYYELTLRAGNRRALAQRFRQAPSDAMTNRIADLHLPTLILWGGRDRLIPPANGERFHHDIAGSELVVFDDLGHVPHEEDPARTVAVVKRFLGVP